MAISNYGELKTKVIAYTARGDLADLVEDFVLAAHESLVADMVLSADLTLDEDAISLPTDCREIVGIWCVQGATSALRAGSPAEMANAGTGVPRYYRRDGNELLLSPAPGEEFAGRLLYRPSRDFFSSDTATNTILTRYPLLYVRGAVAEFMRFDRDQAGEATFGGQFRAGLDAAVAAERRQALGGATPQTFSGIAV